MDFVGLPWPFLIPIVAIVGGLGIAAYGMYLKARASDMAHRERLAMIEKGLVPPPERDPERFERFAGADAISYARWSERRRAKHRNAGFVLVGLGLGLMLMDGVDWERGGFGPGALLVMLGLACLASSFWDTSRPRRDAESKPPGSSPPNPT